MAIVKTYKFGRATVNIHDDYIEKDPKKRQEIINRAFDFVENCIAENLVKKEMALKAAE